MGPGSAWSAALWLSCSEATLWPLGQGTWTLLSSYAAGLRAHSCTDCPGPRRPAEGGRGVGPPRRRPPSRSFRSKLVGRFSWLWPRTLHVGIPPVLVTSLAPSMILGMCLMTVPNSPQTLLVVVSRRGFLSGAAAGPAAGPQVRLSAGRAATGHLGVRPRATGGRGGCASVAGVALGKTLGDQIQVRCAMGWEHCTVLGCTVQYCTVLYCPCSCLPYCRPDPILLCILCCVLASACYLGELGWG